MDLEQIINEIKKAQGEISQREFAQSIGISPQYLNDVYLGRREPGEKLLEPLGFSRRVVYEMGSSGKDKKSKVTRKGSALIASSNLASPTKLREDLTYDTEI